MCFPYKKKVASTSEETIKRTDSIYNGENSVSHTYNLQRYKPGDFSFVEDAHERFLFTYDYNAINTLGENAWDLIYNNDFRTSFQEGKRTSFDLQVPKEDFTPWDTPPGQKWKQIASKMCQAHTEQSYNKSMRLMHYIEKHGWDRFVHEYITTSKKHQSKI